MSDAIVRALAAGGARGTKVADIIGGLVMQGAQLGELESYEFRDPLTGAIKLGKRLPLSWLTRLSKAIETGAIEALTVDRVVEILLRG